MTLTTAPMRPVSPADRPPSRDPKAAGGPPREPEEPGFEAALNESAAGSVEPSSAMPPALTIGTPQAPMPDPQTAPLSATDPEKSETAPDNAAALVPTPTFTALHLPPPGQTPLPSPSAASNTPTEEAAGTETTKPTSLSGPKHKLMLEGPTTDQKPIDASAHPKSEARDFMLPISDAKPSTDIAPLAHTPATMAQSLVDPTPPAPPTASASTPPTPIVALPATIALRALDGTNRFDIRLDPDDLGRVDVSLEIDGDGNIRASIAAERPEALQLIVREARTLEQALDQAGFRREENALSFSLSDRQNPSQGQQDQPTRPQITRFFLDDGTDGLPPRLATNLNAADGRLDVRI